MRLCNNPQGGYRNLRRTRSLPNPHLWSSRSLNLPLRDASPAPNTHLTLKGCLSKQPVDWGHGVLYWPQPLSYFSTNFTLTVPPGIALYWPQEQFFSPTPVYVPSYWYTPVSLFWRWTFRSSLRTRVKRSVRNRLGWDDCGTSTPRSEVLTPYSLKTTKSRGNTPRNNTVGVLRLFTLWTLRHNL